LSLVFQEEHALNVEDLLSLKRVVQSVSVAIQTAANQSIAQGIFSLNNLITQSLSNSVT